jgi:hypothetical protein
MQSNRQWIGVACGVALALSALAAVDAGTQMAGANGGANDDLAQIREELEIVKTRSKQSLSYLAPIRSEADDNEYANEAGVRPGTGGGWTVNKVARGQKQLWARLGPFGGIDASSGPPPPSSDAFRSNPQSSGNYVVDFRRKVSECSWSATPIFEPNGQQPRLAVTQRVDPSDVVSFVGRPAGPAGNDAVNMVRVRILSASGGVIDNRVGLQVVC